MTTPVGFVVWRSAANASPQWGRVVKLQETKTFAEACAAAMKHAKKINGCVRVYPAGADARDSGLSSQAWAEAWYGATINLRHGPSAEALIAAALRP